MPSAPCCSAQTSPRGDGARSEGTKAWVDGTCKPIGLLNAGEALEGVLGNAAKYVWAIGLLAAGQSSTMTGTFAGQHVMSGFLNIEIHAWKRTFFTRAVALGPAIAVAVIAQVRLGRPCAARVVRG